MPVLLHEEGTGIKGERMVDNWEQLSDGEIREWRIKAVDELVLRGWTKAAIADEAGIASSSALYAYTQPDGTLHGKFGYSLNRFLAEALETGTPEDYRNSTSSVAETPTSYPSRERLEQVRTGLQYLTGIVEEIERDLNNNENGAKSASATNE